VRVRGVLGDAGLAGLLAAASMLLGANTFMHSPYQQKVANSFGDDAVWTRHVTWWWLAAVPAVAGLFLRHRWPVPAFGLAAASAVLHQLDAQMPRFPMDLAVLVTLYSVASLARSRRVSLAVLAAALVGLYLLTLATGLGLGQSSAVLHKLASSAEAPLWWYSAAGRAVSDSVQTWLLLGTAWAVGDGNRLRRLHLATVEQRAADLERERDQRAALATAAERARITRELHDVVAHGLSVMVVQAQGGAAALRRHPDRTATALENVIQTGRASLAEMRRLLGLARTDPGGGGTDAGGGGTGAAPQMAPQPGVGALPALVDQVRAAGTPVQLHIGGEPVALPAGVDLSAYRIVQEALTNTLKHAGAGARASVRLDFRPGELEIEVTDDGRLLSTMDDGGSGLRGISERVSMLGGSVTAGPGEGDGFRVWARLPVAAP
jgi:signal transduction histidine kinase